MGSGSSYTVEEVRALVEQYGKLTEAVSASPRRLWLLVRLLDLQDALAKLPWITQMTLLLCGVYGLTRHEGAYVLLCDEKTMDRRYSAGLAALTEILNGGTT